MEMKKKCFSTSFILLTVSVMGAMLNDEVHEVGIEDGAAVIKCHYTASYQPYPKYFCKGIYEDCKTLIKSDSRIPWTFEGRLSLFDDTEKSMFVVNINNLSLGDHGKYGCVVNITEQDLFTVVHLTVRKDSRFTTEERPISTVTSRQGNASDSTGSSSQPTVSISLSGIFIFVGGAFGSVLLVVVFIFCVFICRAIKGSADTTLPNSTEDMDVHLYEKTQRSDPAEENASETSDRMSGPNPSPALKTIYTTASNQMQEPHLSTSLSTNHVYCSVRFHSDAVENHREPKQFPDAGAFNYSMGHNVTYSTVQESYNK